MPGSGSTCVKDSEKKKWGWTRRQHRNSRGPAQGSQLTRTMKTGRLSDNAPPPLYATGIPCATRVLPVEDLQQAHKLKGGK